MATKKLHSHSFTYAVKLVHTRHALSSAIIIFHSEPVLSQACNPPGPHWSLFFWGTNVAPIFPILMWGLVFTACVFFFLFYLQAWPETGSWWKLVRCWKEHTIRYEQAEQHGCTWSLEAIPSSLWESRLWVPEILLCAKLGLPIMQGELPAIT
jgi:hypothetical protein